jgi:hypothetical protein
MSYAAPIADMRFALEACADFWSLRQRYPELDEDTLAAILEGAGALASETLAPLNRSGDRAGVKLTDGVVTAEQAAADEITLRRDGRRHVRRGDDRLDAVVDRHRALGHAVIGRTSCPLGHALIEWV